MSPLEVLQDLFKHDKFRPGQEEIINHVLEGHDTLAILPTGGGKSVCFQIPGLIKPGITIVISPLIALMVDQVQQLKEKGISAEVLHSGLSKREVDILLDNCIYGNIRFLYCSPERIHSPLFEARVMQMTVSIIAVDEAHCISQWGHEFRPAYREIKKLREWFPDVPCIALSASATPPVARDICDQLDFRTGFAIEQQSFARANLSFLVRKAEDKDHKLLEMLSKVHGSAIVYVRSRKGSVSIAQFLFHHGISCTYYHAGLTNEERSDRQRDWQTGKTTVMVSTNAFGMGINKSDVRLVIHYDLPSDLESYYQEAGRAGRDGMKAYATVLINPDDLDIQEKIIAAQFPSKVFLKRVYQALANYFALAVGSEMEEYASFDITGFSDRYDMNASEVYQALLKLEVAGLIQMNQGMFIPSRIRFVVGKTEVYKFEIANVRLEPLIKSLLRLYGGELYNQYTSIHEQQLARSLGWKMEDITKALDALQQHGIAEYLPRKKGPQLMFSTPRKDAGKLEIDYQMLQIREQQVTDKWAIMKAYVQHNKMCRMRFIQRYFGEENTRSCGRCDVCLNKQRHLHTDEEARLRHHVYDILEAGPQDVEYLIMVLDPLDTEEFIELIRRMVDSQEIKYMANWKLALMNYTG